MTALKKYQESRVEETTNSGNNQRGPQVDQPNSTTSKGSSQKPNLVWISSDEEDNREGVSDDDTSDDEFLSKKLRNMSVIDVSVKSTPPATPTRPSAPKASVSKLPGSPAVSTISTLTLKPGPQTGNAASSVPTPYQAPATPGRQGKFNAYVVYSGMAPFYYDRWARVKSLFESDKSLVFKGFYTLEQAKEAYHAAHNSGVIGAIRVGAGRPIWSVTEGVRPAIYESVHDALREGLEWGAGHLKGFSNEADAKEDWVAKASTNPSRIIATASPGFF
ncbi:hypothetical protein F5878DRAFT_665812 [Lentinula raphanica]|uniref:Ribonuclease H1 N-terminal domain-containing protein n=1 Tax=Lentinula raphanica TaxID=153919 RepID=A0AA38NZ01_9AGAR|nr:hypothetical protein F5878DRAFT_665812 [Lentinula raphanica]